MSSGDGPPVLRGRSEDELRGLVERRADQLRSARRVRSLAMSCLVLVMAGTFVAVTFDSGDGRNTEVRTASPAALGTIPPEPGLPPGLPGLPGSPSTIAPSSVPMVTTTATTATTRPVVSTPATTSTTVVCRNSLDPTCGPFYFDPDPEPDRPLTVEVTVSPPRPRVGEEVVFTIVLSDPDGVFSYLNDTSFGDVVSHVDFLAMPCERFGPWDPPQRDPEQSVKVVELRHSYLEPGDYTARFQFGPGYQRCWDPETLRGENFYGSVGEGSVQVSVVR